MCLHVLLIRTIMPISDDDKSSIEGDNQQDECVIVGVDSF
jgi:hypothetical protein